MDTEGWIPSDGYRGTGPERTNERSEARDFFLTIFPATKNHKIHKPDDLLNRTFKLFVDFVPSSG